MTPGSPTPLLVAPAPANPLPIDPGDVCLCTWPNGQSETVSVLAFRADGRADIRPVDRRNPAPLTVPLSFLTALTH